MGLPLLDQHSKLNTEEASNKQQSNSHASVTFDGS